MDKTDGTHITHHSEGFYPITFSMNESAFDEITDTFAEDYEYEESEFNFNEE